MGISVQIKNLLAIAICGIGIFVCSQAAFAQDTFPSGTYTFEFAGDAAVWDVSGTYHEVIAGIDMDLTLSVDSKGKITGFGHADAQMSGVDLSADFSVTGSISKSGSITRVTLNIKMTGNAYYGGRNFKFSATESGRLAVNPASHLMTGSVTVRGTIAGRSIGTQTVALDMPIAADVDGSWDLSVDLTGDARGRITGTGSADVSGGDSFGFTLSGTYTAKRNQATLTVKPDANSKGLSLKLTVQPTGDSLDLQKLSGTVMGQKVAQ